MQNKGQSRLLLAVLALVAVAGLVFSLVLNGQRNALQSSVDALTAQVSETAAESEALRAQVAEASAEAESLRAQVADAAAESEALRTQVADAAAESEALRTQVADAAAESEALRAEADALRQQAEEAAGDALRARNALLETQAELQELKDRIPAFTGNVRFSASPEGIRNLAAQGVTLPEETEKLLESVVGILDQTSLHFVVVDQQLQAELNLKDQPILSLAAQQTGAGTQILSDLFPSSVVTLRAETLSGLIRGAAESFTPNRVQELVRLLEPHWQRTAEAMSARLGEPEAVSLSLAGSNFTTRTPLNMSSRELALLALNLLKELRDGEPTLQPVISQLRSRSGKNLDEVIAQVESAPEEHLPEMTAFVYGNEAGEALYELSLVRGAQTLSCQFGRLTDRFVLRLNQPDTLKAELKGSLQKGTLELRMEGRAQNLPVALTASLTGAERKARGGIALQMNGTELLAVDFDLVPGGDITVPFDTAELTSIPLEELFADPTGVACQQLRSDFSENGLLRLLKSAKQAMPEEVGVLLSAMGVSPEENQ